eukprot:Nk52_evm1s1485 gene=Nk52_evmTU1s1485
MEAKGYVRRRHKGRKGGGGGRVMLMLLLFLCFTVDMGASQQQTVTIKIGLGYNYLSPVTGSVREAFDGVKLLRDIIQDHSDGILDNEFTITNPNSGRSVVYHFEFVMYPTWCNEAGGVEGAYHFSLVNRVHAILGMVCSSSTAGAIRITSLFRIPVISWSSSSALLSDHVTYPYFLRTIADDTRQSEVIVDVVNHFGWRKVSVISSKDTYSLGLYQATKANASKKGVSFWIDIQFKGATLDAVGDAGLIRSHIKTLRDSSSRIILMLLSGTDGAVVFEAMKAENFVSRDIVIVTPDALSVSGARPWAAGAAEKFVGHLGVQITGSIESPLVDAINAKWKTTQYEDLDNDGEIGPVSALDAFLAIAYGFQEVINQNGNIDDGVDVYEKMKSTSFDGLSSKRISFNAMNGDFNSAVYQVYQYDSAGSSNTLFRWEEGSLTQERDFVWSEVPLDGSCPNDCSAPNGNCDSNTATCSCLASFAGDNCNVVSPIPISTATSGIFAYASSVPCKSATYFTFIATEYTVEWGISLETGRQVGNDGAFDALLLVEHGNKTMSETLSQGFAWNVINQAPFHSIVDGIQTFTTSSRNESQKGLYTISVIPTGHSCPAPGFRIFVKETSTLIRGCDSIVDGKIFYEDFELANESNIAGLVITVTFLLLFVLCVAYVGFRSIKRSRLATVKAIDCSHGMELSVTNTIAVGSAVVESVQLLSLCLDTDLDWDTISPLQMISEAIGFGKQSIYFWSFWLAVVASCLWLFYTLSLKMQIFQTLEERFTFVKFLLIPRAYYLPLIADVGFIPISQTFLKSFRCVYLPTQQVVLEVNDCETDCWTDTHYIHIAFAILLSITYCPYVIRSSYYWQDLSRNLQVIYIAEFHVRNAIFKLIIVFLVVIFYTNTSVVLGIICVLCAYFIYWIQIRHPCNFRWISLTRQVGLFIAIQLCIFGAVLHQVRDNETVFTGLFFGFAIVEVGCALGFIWFKYSPLFDSKKRSKKSDVFFKNKVLMNMTVSRKGSVYLMEESTPEKQKSSKIFPENMSSVIPHMLSALSGSSAYERGMVMTLMANEHGLFKLCQRLGMSDTEQESAQNWRGLAYLLASLAYFKATQEDKGVILERFRNEILLKQESVAAGEVESGVFKSDKDMSRGAWQ